MSNVEAHIGKIRLCRVVKKLKVFIMVNHEETTPRDREDRNAPITAAENPVSSPKRDCFKPLHSQRSTKVARNDRAQLVELIERRNVTMYQKCANESFVRQTITLLCRSYSLYLNGQLVLKTP